MPDIAASYLPLKAAHVTLVACSGMLFGLRGAGVLARHRWPMARPVRLASVLIDSLLLAAGITLLLRIALPPLQAPWLATKLALLPVYIVLGSFALKRARTAQGRLLCCVAALAVYGHIIAIALLHHPLGMLSLLIE